jgi:predicted O-methyltransferase YrrM
MEGRDTFPALRQFYVTRSNRRPGGENLAITAEYARAAGIALRNLVLGANLAALRLGSPRRIVQYASDALFLRGTLARERGLPERNVWEVLDADRDVSVRLANVLTPSWPDSQPAYLADIVSLCRLCALVRPRRVFEIGTYTGYSTLHLALNAPPDATILTLDLPKQDDLRPLRPALRTTVMDDAHIGGATAERAYLFAGLPEAERIALLFGDSATFDFAPWHGAIDLFFIDGAHSYEYVRSDTRAALRCVRPGGVIAWHDFGRAGLNGVSRWLRECRADGLPVHAVPGCSLAFMVVPAGR